MRLGFPGGFGGSPAAGTFEFDRNWTDILLGGSEPDNFNVGRSGAALSFTSAAGAVNGADESGTEKVRRGGEADIVTSDWYIWSEF